MISFSSITPIHIILRRRRCQFSLSPRHFFDCCRLSPFCFRFITRARTRLPRWLILIRHAAITLRHAITPLRHWLSPDATLIFALSPRHYCQASMIIYLFSLHFAASTPERRFSPPARLAPITFSLLRHISRFFFAVSCFLIFHFTPRRLFQIFRLLR
jgi:hypothetical protein